MAKRTHKLTNEQKAAVIMRYVRGDPEKIVAYDFGITKAAVTLLIKYHGIPLRRPQKRGRPKA